MSKKYLDLECTQAGILSMHQKFGKQQVSPHKASTTPAAPARIAPILFTGPRPTAAFDNVAAGVALDPVATAAATNVPICVLVTTSTLVWSPDETVVVTTIVLVVEPVVCPLLPVTV
jgi:hypothetical protein